MKKSVKIKFIIIAIILFLLFFMAIVINIRDSYINKYGKQESKSNDNSVQYKQEKPADLYTDTSIKEVETMSLLLATQETINKYYVYINRDEPSALMNILDKDYISSNGITVNNVVNKLRPSSTRSSFFATKVYSKEISFDHEYKYWVFGKSYVENEGFYTEQFIVNLDLSNKTFKITPVGESTEELFSNYMDRIIHTDNGEVTVADGAVTYIEANEYNKFSIYEGNDGIKKAIENYARYYYLMQIYDKEGAYELLDDAYKNARFSNKNEYMNSNIVWKNIDIKYVRKVFDEDKTQYIGIDKNGTYYIFYESSPMDYKILLDSYTVPLEETVKRYNESNSIEKACMCVKTVEEMINNKDYKTMYDRMNSIFKQNNFSTQQSFESHIKSKYYMNCKFDFVSYKASEDSYIINVKVTNLDSESEFFETEYVVKLKDGIDNFEYSFSME